MAKPPLPVVRTTPPPSPLIDISDRPDGGFSFYDENALRHSAGGQVVVVDTAGQVSKTIGTTEALEPPVAIESPVRRNVPLAVLRSRPAPAPIQPEKVGADGPLTIGELPPPSVVPVSRLATVMENAPPAPKPKRKAIVKFTSFGPANTEEQSWVIGGDTGMRLVTTDEGSGRRRLVAVYIAAMVDSYAKDDTTGEIVVFVKVRWHGMPADRDAAWRHKFLRRDGEKRLKEFKAALELHFGFADPRIGMVQRFLGGPATTAEVAALHGYHVFPGNGSPSVKFMVDMSFTQAGVRAAIDFYRAAQDLSALSLWRWWWSWFNPAREALYVLGERYEIEGLPPAKVKVSLTASELARLEKDVAVAAAGPVASCGKVAWRGDQEIEQALMERQLEPVAYTTYTVYQEGE